MPSKCKKHKSTMITVEQLVDIALGTPEIGVVNFNVLHAVIHVIIQQLNIQRCMVEFKGSDSERMEALILTAKPGPIVKVSEYLIDQNEGKPCGAPGSRPTSQPTNDAPPGKVKSALLKHESTVCGPKGGAGGGGGEDGRGRPCDCGGPPLDPKRLVKDETEKIDTAQEKHDKSKEEAEEKAHSTPPPPPPPPTPTPTPTPTPMPAKEETTPKKAKKKAGAGDETDPESDKEKKSKKERCREKKLAKRRKREEEEVAAAGGEEKSEAEQSEKEKKEPEDEPSEKKKRSCPCKEEHKLDECPEAKMKESGSPYYGSESDGACLTVVRVETLGERCDTWRSRPALAHESLVKLEEKVTLLQDAFETLEKMPTNEELMKRTSGGGCLPTPVKDMWQLYNLNKRVESCEGAIEKLASMIEDLVKETCNFREALMVIADAVDSMECSEDTCGNRPSPCCGAPPGQPHRPGAPSTVAFAPTTKQEVTLMPMMAPSPCGAFSKNPSALKATPGGGTAPVGADQQTAEVQVGAGGAEEEQGGQRGRLESDDFERGPPGTIGPEFFRMSNGEKFCVLKEAIECLGCQIKSFTDMIPLDQLAAKLCAIVTMQKQLENLQKEWEHFLQSFSDEGVPGTVAYIKALRTDIEAINETIAKIMEDRRQLEMTIQSLSQEIQLLKAIKADKETMEDLLAEKADASLVNRKVSHDQFDAACDDLTKGLDDALMRLIAQEAMWNEAMEELQKDLENKLDKMEIMPLKEFINKKLKGLQEKLKQLAQMRKDAEAAGAKSRILRNINCIACDNDVVMRMDNKNASQQPSLPPSRSMKPYISYELDQVRKALKKGPTCRALNPVEEIVTDSHRKNAGLPLVHKEPDTKVNKLEHYCNRYCGGSHTITTPQQRVTRIGHFLTEFGPQAMSPFGTEECKAPAGEASVAAPAHKDGKHA